MSLSSQTFFFFFKVKLKTLHIHLGWCQCYSCDDLLPYIEMFYFKYAQFLDGLKCTSSRRLWALWSSLVRFRLLSGGNTWARGRRESSSIKQFSYCDLAWGMWFGPRYRKTCSLVRLRGYRQPTCILYPKVTERLKNLGVVLREHHCFTSKNVTTRTLVKFIRYIYLVITLGRT